MIFKLTPVQNCNGLWLKRDDLFKPFGLDSVNGGKLRQCFSLVDSIKNDYKGVISFCSIHSPQAPITSAVAKYFGLECMIFYGGTTKEKIKGNEMSKIALEFGAKIKIVAKTGRHNVLKKKALEFAKNNNYFVIEYGFNIIEYPDLILNSISNQVENIPEELENLVITCGSGITTTGVLIGLKKFNKKIKNIYLVDTAPNRLERIKKNLLNYNIKCDDEFNIKVCDLFNRNGFQYEKGIKVIYKGIKLHPQYEAKTFNWLYNESGIDLKNNKTLFWIVGSEPKSRR